ncbi:MAG: hypothetical protein ACJ8AV_09905, partial [Gemmatimonadales bacterium]
LTVAEFMRWIQALPPQYATQLRQANDTMLNQFARVLTQNVLLLRQADSAKIQITPAEWKDLADTYRAQVDSLRADMGLDTAGLWDSTVSAADRNKVAATKVEDYFGRLGSGKSRLRPLPAAMGSLLRDQSSYRVYDAGLNRAVELAQAQRPKTDSTQAQTGPMQRAPGPAPIPGIAPTPGEPQAPTAAPGAGKSPESPGAKPPAGARPPKKKP